jgi:ribosomal protein L11 methyltransferase
MCAAMFQTDFRNKRVLDMGCGTGVLAILAKKLGASDILAIDIDEWSVQNSAENCATNSAAGIEVKLGDIGLLRDEKEFEVILANINKNILKAHLPAYSGKLKTGGLLFLSGFFKTDVEELTAIAAKNGLKLKAKSVKEEWAMLMLERD